MGSALQGYLLRGLCSYSFLLSVASLEMEEKRQILWSNAFASAYLQPLLPATKGSLRPNSEFRAVASLEVILGIFIRATLIATFVPNTCDKQMLNLYHNNCARAFPCIGLKFNHKTCMTFPIQCRLLVDKAWTLQLSAWGRNVPCPLHHIPQCRLLISVLRS